jgi:transaldolase/glucose-6-phosphate isomerase
MEGNGMDARRGKGGNDRLVLDLCKYQAAVEARLDRWRRQRFLRRMWAKDHTLWSTEAVAELSDRLGWLFLPETMKARLGEMEAFAEEAKRVGIKNVLLLGMGGSSLAPELFQTVFGNRKGRPSLAVLDSTHPEAIRRLEEELDLQSTLFIVSSKSGGTTETSSFFKYFWKRIPDSTAEPGAHFAAITDPDTSLAKLGEELRFRKVFLSDPEVGGRYSAH